MCDPSTVIRKLPGVNYLKAEAAQRSTVWRDLAAYDVANDATHALAFVLGEFALPPTDEGDAAPLYWRQKAVFFLAVLALRAARAGVVLVASGYGHEAFGPMRTVMEAHKRVELIRDDKTGGRARNWLRDGDGKPGKQADVPELWNTLSQSAHADRRAVENFLIVTREDQSHGLVTHPERRTEVDNGTLLMIAGNTRDIAVGMANLWGKTLDTERIDAALRESSLFASEPDQTY